MSKWQLCPLCKGVGQVSGGYFGRAGDCETWASSNTIEMCQICNGKGVITDDRVRAKEGEIN